MNTILNENSDNVIRHKLIKKYNLFYNHWLDYCILVSVLAIIGLGLSWHEWDVVYKSRNNFEMVSRSEIFS